MIGDTCAPAAAAAPPARPAARVFAAAIVAAGAALYLSILEGLARQWVDDSAASYGLFVAAAAAFALWQRWPRLAFPQHGGSWWGLAGLGGAALLYVAGTLSADLFLLRTSFVATLAAATLLLLGGPALRVLAPPLVLLQASIPLPAAAVTELTLPLQLAASRLAADALWLLGVDVIRDGNLLTLSYITLEVAEACSGMRSLITLLALVAVYWATCGASLCRTLLLAAAALPVALAGNALRVVVTALLASRLGEAAAEGAVHDTTGFFAFLAMGGALAAIHLALPSARSSARPAW